MASSGQGTCCHWTTSIVCMQFVDESSRVGRLDLDSVPEASEADAASGWNEAIPWYADAMRAMSNTSTAWLGTSCSVLELQKFILPRTPSSRMPRTDEALWLREAQHRQTFDARARRPRLKSLSPLIDKRYSHTLLRTLTQSGVSVLAVRYVAGLVFILFAGQANMKDRADESKLWRSVVSLWHGDLKSSLGRHPQH